MAWAKYPSNWVVQERTLARWYWRTVKGGGTSALVIYLLVAVLLNRGHMGGKNVPETGVALTYDEIESFTNLSRSMVSQGLKLLVHYQLIVVTPIGRARSYSLRDYALPDGWAKIPQDRIFTPSRGLFAFKGASHRSRHEFNALKLYLVLLSVKPNTANYAQIGYEKISEYTGIAKTDIRKAVSNLIEYGLVTVSSGESWTTGAAPPNRYVIAGL